MNRAFLCLALAAAAAFGAGCSSPRANPASAKAGRGYVDFHTTSAEPLSWEISRLDVEKGAYKTVFSEFKPEANSVIRLAFGPGMQRFRVNFLNRLIAAPEDLEIELRDGMVTPVTIALTEGGMVAVRTRDFRYGGTFRGRWGRINEFGNAEQAYYRIAATVAEPVSYQRLQAMPYYRGE